MQTIAQNNFITVKTEGGILPAELLQRIADGQAAGMDPADYHLPSGERPSEAINRAWNRLGGAWQTFQRKMDLAAPSETGTTLTREWLLTLLQELGYGRLPYQGSLAVGSKGIGSGGMNDFPTPPLPHSPIPSYPISHLYDHTPIHLISFRQKLDTRDTSELPTPHSALRTPQSAIPTPHSLPFPPQPAARISQPQRRPPLGLRQQWAALPHPARQRQPHPRRLCGVRPGSDVQRRTVQRLLPILAALSPIESRDFRE